MESNIFYSRLKELVRKSGKSFNKVERDLGFPRNSLNNYKNNRQPSAIRMMQLAKYFHVSPEYLFGVSNDLVYCNDKSVEKTLRQIFEELRDEQKREMFLICQEWLLENL